ncbi:folate-biopterin transporter [Globomyces pollinis-pini]|nr:folate-biopterin transporter [Globomyces pollinis-pini]
MISGAIDWFRRNNELHGWAMVVLAGYTYLAQGGGGYTDLSFQWISIYGFKLKRSDVQSVKAIGGLPFTLKFVIGLISDNLPIIGYNVKPYMLLMAGIGFVALTMMGIPALTGNFTTLSAAYLVIQLYGSSIDCLTDSLVIKKGRNDELDSTSALQSISWFMFGIGGSVFSLLATYLLVDLNAESGINLPGARFYNLLMAIFPFGIFALSFFVKEEKSKIRPGFKVLGQQLIRLVIAFSSHIFLVLRLVAWFILAGAARFSLTIPSVMFNFTYLNISPYIQTWIDFGSYLALSGGVFVYYRFFRHTSFRYIYGASQILLGIFGLLDYALVQRWNIAIGIPDVPFLFVSGVLVDGIERLQTMPFLIMAGQLCPPNIEATYFSVLMSLMSLSNYGFTIGQWIGVKVQKAHGITYDNLDGYGPAILLRVATTCACVLLIWLIPDTNAMNPTNAEFIKPTHPTLKAIFKWADLDSADEADVKGGSKAVEAVKQIA